MTFFFEGRLLRLQDENGEIQKDDFVNFGIIFGTVKYRQPIGGFKRALSFK